MLNTTQGFRGAVTAPHHLAAQAGQDILAEGGSAVEAMVAMAATIAVTYPHMNGIGGDGFWLIKRKDAPVQAIFAGGHSAALASRAWYEAAGFTDAIPTRGAKAALTVPGSVDGWRAALEAAPSATPLPLSRLLEHAIYHAEAGFPVSNNQSQCITDKIDGLKDVPGFADTYLFGGAIPVAGARFIQPAMAATLRQIAQKGIADYYHGDLAKTHAAFLEAQGSPLRLEDFTAYSARAVTPLSVKTSKAMLYNMIPPTQGMSSLMILGIYDRIQTWAKEGVAPIHALIEATKQAFILRNRELGDLSAMRQPPETFLQDQVLDDLAGQIDHKRALPWPYEPKDGDTIWMGASDAEGTSVSFIQSVYWEFGSGLTCPDTGVFFQNRGAGFGMGDGPNQIAPRKVPFHTLNPAMAVFEDGRVMAYGTMGGEGQPQTQAAIFARYAYLGQELQQAVTAPRWLLGRTWGDATTSLKLEARFDPDWITALSDMGHETEILPDYSDLVGHAGAVVTHLDGLVEAATDPRANGLALAR
jgi:gamma-glutamyltranspeptidase/glutathione hydrolase